MKTCSQQWEGIVNNLHLKPFVSIEAAQGNDEK